VVTWGCIALMNQTVVVCPHTLQAPQQHAIVLWTHANPATCLGQLGLSLFLWSAARWGPWGTWQHWSSPLREARPGPCCSARAHLGREARSGAEEHVAAPELSSRGGRAWSHGTHGDARAHLSREAMSGAKEHVAASELNSARRQGPETRVTWQHRSPPQQGGDVRDCRTLGGSEAHLCREVWSKATACVAAHGCMPCSLS
jgi:hypothetical protein